MYNRQCTEVCKSKRSLQSRAHTGEGSYGRCTAVVIAVAPALNLPSTGMQSSTLQYRTALYSAVQYSTQQWWGVTHLALQWFYCSLHAIVAFNPELFREKGRVTVFCLRSVGVDRLDKRPTRKTSGNSNCSNLNQYISEKKRKTKTGQGYSKQGPVQIRQRF
jgi:hypothetical protein